MEMRVQVYASIAIPREKIPDTYQTGGLVVPQNLSVLHGEDENILFLPVFGPWIVHSLAWSLYFRRNPGSPFRN